MPKSNSFKTIKIRSWSLKLFPAVWAVKSFTTNSEKNCKLRDLMPWKFHRLVEFPPFLTESGCCTVRVLLVSLHHCWDDFIADFPLRLIAWERWISRSLHRSMQTERKGHQCTEEWGDDHIWELGPACSWTSVLKRACCGILSRTRIDPTGQLI